MSTGNSLQPGLCSSIAGLNGLELEVISKQNNTEAAAGQSPAVCSTRGDNQRCMARLIVFEPDANRTVCEVAVYGYKKGETCDAWT